MGRAGLAHPPLSTEIDGDSLIVTTRDRSDFWRHTGYGVVHDNGHALLTEFVDGQAVEVTFLLRFDTLFDQAGLMVRVDDETWIKAGAELSDGLPNWARSSRTAIPTGRPRRSPMGRPPRDDPSQSHGRRRRHPSPPRDRSLATRTPRPPATHRPREGRPHCCSPEREGLRVRFTTASPPARPTSPYTRLEHGQRWSASGVSSSTRKPPDWWCQSRA